MTEKSGRWNARAVERGVRRSAEAPLKTSKSLVSLPCPAPGLPGSPLAAVLQCVK